MSRIGKLPISIPTGVTVTLKDNVVTVKGPRINKLAKFAFWTFYSYSEG